MKKILLLLLLLFLSASASAAALREQGGDIFYVGDDGKSQRLTTGRNNGGAVLSPDGHKVAYLHIKPGNQRDDKVFRGKEIWLVDITGKNARRLLKTHLNDGSAEANLAQFNSLAFSVTGERLYFLSAAWMETDALHVLDWSTGKQQYVTEANSLLVIRSGRYAGHLIVEQHHYLEEGGASDYYWLLTPAGKEVQVAGETWQQVNKFIKSQEIKGK